jgi:hypothetical protein
VGRRKSNTIVQRLRHSAADPQPEERGCVVLDQPQRLRQAGGAPSFSTSWCANVLRLVEDDTAALPQGDLMIAIMHEQRIVPLKTNQLKFHDYENLRRGTGNLFSEPDNAR